jgi:hypothetical protein
LTPIRAFITQRLPDRVNTFLKGCGLQPFFQRAPGAHVRIQIGFSPFPICKGAAGDRMYVTARPDHFKQGAPSGAFLFGALSNALDTRRRRLGAEI